MKLDIGEKTNVLLGIFVAALVAANLLGTKITAWQITGTFAISASVGILAFPLTFLITDIVEEVHGRRKATSFVYAGFISLALVFILTTISVVLPPASRYTANEAYVTVFGSSLRIILASLVAFGISQTHDLWAFNYLRQKTRGKHLWLRNNLSTMASQFLDTTVFMFLAFYMMTPKFTAGFIFQLILPYWLLKVLVAALDTPFCYAGVRWLRK